MASYRYLACELDGRVRDELILHDVTFSHVLNRAGAMTCMVPTLLADPNVLIVSRTLLYVERTSTNGDKRIVWSGTLEAAKASAKHAGQIQFTFRSLWAFVHGCKQLTTIDFELVDQLQIARTLVDSAFEDPRRLLTITTGDELSGKVRDRTYYGYEAVNIGKAVEQLAAVTNGFDFAVESRYEDGTIVDRLRLYYPRMGGQSPTVFELDTTIQELELTVEGTQLGTRAIGAGAGEGEQMLLSVAEDVGDGGFPLKDITAAWKDVRVQETLDDHVTALLTARGRPVEIPTFPLQVLPDRPETDWVTGGWRLGDDVGIRAVYGWINLEQRQRIIGTQVSVSNEGAESVDVTVAPAAAFAYGGA